MKSNTHRRSAQKRKHGTEPRKQFAIDDGSDSESSQTSNRGKRVHQQSPERRAPQDQNVLFRYGRQKIECLTVPIEEDRVQRRLRITLPYSNKHRLSKHQASHFRQEDDEYSSRRRRFSVPSTSKRPQREQATNEDTHNAIDPALKLDVHGFPNKRCCRKRRTTSSWRTSKSSSPPSTIRLISFKE